MSIEKHVSPFIPQQFPALYKEQGPNFIAFVQAYYEWMEQSNQTVGHARHLLDYADIDTTTQDFIEYFKNTYIHAIPESIISDKRLLVKHILDLYRSKGTPRAYALLFRMVFDEEIELYIPGDYVFKPSDNRWYVPRYIEVTSSSGLNDVVGTQIRNSAGATAIVETFFTRMVNNRIVNVLEVSNVRGRFKNGDRVYQTRVNGSIGVANSVTMVGSLSGISVTAGGIGFSVGEYVDVIGSGVEGKARIVSVDALNTGGVAFTLLSGGSGYTTNAVVTVKATLNILVNNNTGFFLTNTSLVDSTTSANGTIVFANTSIVRLVDFSNTLVFSAGDTVTSSTGSATVVSVAGGSGQGATFSVGAIRDTEIFEINTDLIGPYESLLLDQASSTMSVALTSITGTFTVGHTVNSSANAVLLEGYVLSTNNAINGEFFANADIGVANLYIYRADGGQCLVTGTEAELTNANLQPGVILVSNTTRTTLQLAIRPSKITVTGNATITSFSSPNVVLSAVNGYFVATRALTSNAGATGTISSVTRLTDWVLPANSGNTNLDTAISIALTNRNMEVGTIAYLSEINPGSSYTSRPYVDITEPDIAALNIVDALGNFKGKNAAVDVNIVGGNGVIKTVDIISSGFGYLPNETVTLSGTEGRSASGASIVYTVGTGEGRWLSRKSFSSDLMKIHDGYYYQTFSYDIISSKLLSTYETMVKDLVHPSGIALFGRYRLLDIYSSDVSLPLYVDLKSYDMNRFLWSEVFSNAAWTKNDAIIVDSSAISPDGSTTGTKIIEAATNADHRILQAVSTTSRSAVFTIYAKAAERFRVALRITHNTVPTEGGQAVYDLNATTVTSTSLFGAAVDLPIASIVDVGNGWRRLSISISASTSATTMTAFFYVINIGTLTYLGDGVSGIHVWGAQIEDGITAHDYVQTTSTPFV